MGTHIARHDELLVSPRRIFASRLGWDPLAYRCNGLIRSVQFVAIDIR